METSNDVFDVGTVIDDACSWTRHKLSEKPVIVWGFIQQKIPFFAGDQIRLRNILLGLLSHIVPVVQKGEIIISAGLDQTVSAGEKISLIFSIKYVDSDTSKASEDVLVPLSKDLSQKTDDHSHQTEHDLATIKAMIESEDGKLWEQSSANNKEIFFTARFARGHMSSLTMKIQKLLGSGDGSIKILVIEDSMANQVVLKTYLQLFGCSVDLAENGLDAVNMLRQKSYDLCFMDIQMPVMNGLDATKIIRAEISKTMPIIALTAIEEDPSVFLSAGMTEYILKPVNLEMLEKIVTRYAQKAVRVS